MKYKGQCDVCKTSLHRVEQCRTNYLLFNCLLKIVLVLTSSSSVMTNVAYCSSIKYNLYFNSDTRNQPHGIALEMASKLKVTC